jgi:hypothetical protein
MSYPKVDFKIVLEFGNVGETLGEALQTFTSLAKQYGNDTELDVRYGWDGAECFDICTTREMTDKEKATYDKRKAAAKKTAAKRAEAREINELRLLKKLKEKYE